MKSRFRASSLLVLGLSLFLTNSCRKEKPFALPVLYTAAITDITSTSVISGGKIASDGGASITARGVCWSTGITPTISDSKTIDGAGAGGGRCSTGTGGFDKGRYGHCLPDPGGTGDAKARPNRWHPGPGQGAGQNRRWSGS